MHKIRCYKVSFILIHPDNSDSEEVMDNKNKLVENLTIYGVNEIDVFATIKNFINFTGYKVRYLCAKEMEENK